MPKRPKKPCPTCNFLQSYANFRKHVDNCKEYQCRWCPAVFWHKTKLALHVLDHLDGEWKLT